MSEFTGKSHGSNLAGGSVGLRQGTPQCTPPRLYHSSAGETIRIYDGHRYIVSGTFFPVEGVFYKRMKDSHVLQRPPAIAIQAETLDELLRRGCSLIRVDISDGRRLAVSFLRFMTKGFPMDRGYGAQIALSLEHWQSVDSFQQSLFEEGA